MVLSSMMRLNYLASVQTLSEQSEDLHAAAIAFALHDQTVASALVGARTTEQLLDSIIAYENKTENREIDALRNIANAHIYKEHRL